MAKEKNSLNDIISKEFQDMVDLSLVDTKVKNWYDTGVYALNYIMSKNLFGGVPSGRVTAIDGKSGCLSGDTKVLISRGKRLGSREYTLEELYIKINGGNVGGHRVWDDRLENRTYSFIESNDAIRQNKIKKVYKQGVQKTWTLKTENGLTIRATEDHPFKVLNENGRGDVKKDNFVHLSKLVVGDEIMFRDLDYEELDESHKRFNNCGYGYTKVVSIEYYGEEMTYDIEMDSENKNYVANNLVVHNTGKSLISAKTMADPRLDLIILIDVEGGGHGRELIDFAGVDPSKVRRVTANTFTSYKISKSKNTIEEIRDIDLPAKLETDKYIYVEGIISKIRRLIQSVTFNKIDANILIVLDSLANIRSVRALAGTTDMGKRAQDINAFFGNFDVEFEKTNISFIFTNKLYSTMDGFGTMVASGGEAAVYNPSLTVRLRDVYDTDDLTAKQMDEQKDSRKTAIGRTIKPIRATIIKSRFGTEQRNITFLIDMAYGPVKLSGLFELCLDFGVIKKAGGAYYSMPDILEKNFYKRDFIELISQDEEGLLKKIQAKLELAEEELRESRAQFQANDIDEVDQDMPIPHLLDEGEDSEIEKEESFSEMKKIMERERD